MRTFIGCDIFHPHIKDVLLEVENTEADIKFVEPHNMHVTLKFLGDIPEGQVNIVKGAMRETCSGKFPIKAELKGVGVFPGLNYIKVIWIGLNCPELVAIQKRLDESLREKGFKSDKRFQSHLTIGRLRSGKNKESLKERISQLENHDIGVINIDSVKLKMSNLTPSGPIYKDIITIK